MQGLKNEKIKRLKAYANLIDLVLLKQLSNIDEDKCKLMYDKKTYIRKYTLE